MVQFLSFTISDELLFVIIGIIISIIFLVVGVSVEHQISFYLLLIGCIVIIASIIIAFTGLDSVVGQGPNGSKEAYRFWTIIILFFSSIISIYLSIKHYALISIKAGKV